MAFHIVTKNCFLVCEKVTSVILEEVFPDGKPVRKTKKKPGPKKKESEEDKQFSINIAYYPVNTSRSQSSSYNSSSGAEEQSVEFRIIGRKEATALFNEIIKEVQEQHPNEAYLDKLVTKILSEDELKENSIEEA
jgi:hypothetical protein